MESKRAYRDAPGSDIKLPKAVYYRCVWIVRDRSRLEKLASVLDENRDFAWKREQEESGNTAAIVSDAAAKQAAHELECIVRALGCIPEVYREGLLDNIIEKKPFSDFAHPNTWKRWKLVFLYELARRLYLI